MLISLDFCLFSARFTLVFAFISYRMGRTADIWVITWIS